MKAGIRQEIAQEISRQANEYGLLPRLCGAGKFEKNLHLPLGHLMSEASEDRKRKE
jgi:hypothetical protein